MLIPALSPSRSIAVYVASLDTHTPPISEYTRAYTMLPSMGNPSNTYDVSVPMSPVNRSQPPRVVPSVSQYSLTPAASFHSNVSDVLLSVDPLAGLVNEAFVVAALQVKVTSDPDRVDPGAGSVTAASPSCAVYEKSS